MRILLIHDSPTVQKIVRAFLATEMPEAAVDCAPADEGLVLLHQRKFDLVVSGVEMVRVDGFEVYRQLQETMNRGVPFVALTSNRSPKHIARLDAHSIHHRLFSPFTAPQLRRLIDDAWQPRSRREHERFSIPMTQAIFFHGGQTDTAAVINLSISGMLCEGPAWNGPVDVVRMPQCSLVLPPDYDDLQVRGLKVSLVRLVVTTFEADGTASRIQTAWAFRDLPVASAEALVQVLDRAREQLAHAAGGLTVEAQPTAPPSAPW